jgi:hypothetical protein
MMSSWKDWPILARVLCVLIPLQALFVIALTIERIVTLTAANHGQLDDDTKIAIVLCLSYLPFTYNAVSAIALENKYQLFSFLVLNGIVLFYCAYDFAMHMFDEQNHLKLPKLIRLVFVAVFAPINVVLGLCAFRDFGWVAARTVGTMIEKVVLFERYQLLIAAVKLDAQMHLTLMVMALLFVNAADVAFMISDIVVLALSVPWAVALYYAARSERQCLMQFAIVIGAAHPAYIAVRLAQTIYDSSSGVVHGGRNRYAILTIALITIVLRVLTEISAVRVWRGFGGGLVDVLQKNLIRRPRAEFAIATSPLLEHN